MNSATAFLVAFRGENLPSAARQKTDRFLGGLPLDGWVRAPSAA